MAVVNEVFAKMFFPNHELRSDTSSRRVVRKGANLRIVGLAKNARCSSLKD